MGHQYSRKGERTSRGVSQQCEGDAETANLILGSTVRPPWGRCKRQLLCSVRFGGYLGSVPVPKAQYTAAITCWE